MNIVETLHSPDEEVRRAAVAALAGGDAELALLMYALGDESWRVRKEAALRASAWPNQERAAAVLVETLAERDNVGRRNAAVEALGRLGTVALPSLFAALERMPEHRKLIVDTLGLLADARAASRLIAVLSDPDPNVRAAAAEALGRIGGAEAEAALFAGLDESDLLVSLACLEALNLLGTRLPLARLVPLLSTTVLRPDALDAIGNSGDPAAAEAILPWLADQSRAVRQAATVALDRLYCSVEESAKPGSRRLGGAPLDAPVMGARLRVAAACKAMPQGAEPLLIQALLEAAVPTRRAAATVLALSGRESAVPPLLVALGDHDLEEAASSALRYLGVAATAPIVAAAAELDADRRTALLRLLPALGAEPRLSAFAVAALDDADPDVAAEAARALGEIGGREAISPLKAALASASRMQVAAAAALERLAERFPSDVRALFGDGDLAGAAEAAARACRIIGACRLPGDVPLLLGLLRAPSVDLRAAAVDALAGFAAAGLSAEPAIAAALAASLSDPEAMVRAAVVRGFDRFPSESVVEQLARGLADGDLTVRAAAVRALATRGTPAAIRLLRDREPIETDPLVRATIAAALPAARPA